jgi:hypothetical protein
MKRYKIATALLLSTVFLLRLLVVNVGLLTSVNENHKSNLSKHHSSTLKKRRRSVELTDFTRSSEYSITDACEEMGDDDDEASKINPLNFVKSLFSYLTDFTSSIRSNIFFDPDHYQIASKKYLAISVLRI